MCTSTFLIADDYTSFTVKHYAKANVVLDDYGVGPLISVEVEI